MATPLAYDVLFRDRGAIAGFNKLAGSMSAADKASDELAASQKQLAAAQAKAADAAGSVKIAEAKLDAIRKNAKATAVQKLQAEENLSRVQRRLSMAQTDVTASTRRLKVAQQQVGEQVEHTSGRMRRAIGGLHAFGAAGVNTTGRLVGGFKMVGAGAAGVAAGILAAAAAPVTFGLKTAAANEQAEISFTTMLGSAQKAQAFLEKMKAFAAATPFEMADLQTAASSLISVGINANKVIPIMRTLGDVTSGMGTGSEGIQRATIALQQMNAAQRITGEDLNQLRDAGIPVFDLLAAATGKSKQKVVELAQAGKLGKKELDALMKALESGKGLERFNGLMDKQSKSLTGMISTLKDTFGQGMADALQGAIPFIKGGIGVITKDLSRFFKWIQTHQEDMVDSFVDAGEGVFQLSEAFLHLSSTALDAFAGIIDAVAAFTDSLAKLPFIGKQFRGIGDSLRPMAAGIRGTAGQIGTQLLPKIEEAHSKWTKFGKDQRTQAALRDSNQKITNAVERTNESLKKNGKILDSNTEKGRNNRTALRNLVDANRAYIDKLKETGASTKRVDRATDDARQSFIRTAIKMGATKREAKELADKFGLVDRKINDLNNKTVRTKVTFSVSGSGFKIHIPNSLSVVKQMATGGPVRGGGTGTSDSVPAMLSHGEHVLTAREVDALGGHSQVLAWRKSLPHFAGGGVVDPRIYSNRFPDPFYTASSLRSWTARGISRLVGDAIGKNTAAFMPSFGGGGFTAASGGSNRAIGYRMMLQRWNASQWPPLNSLWTRESGWNTFALNRSSGAYGIPQSLPAGKMASAGSDWRTNPATQIAWGLGYIAARYGSPSGAWAHSQATGWYDRGGVLRPGLTLAYNGTGRNEYVVPGGGGGGGGVTVNQYISLPNYVGSHSDIANALVTLKRQGRLDVVLRSRPT